MKKELQEKLFEAFPKLYAERILPATHTCMCWGICTGDGWFQLIWDLSEKLEPLCNEQRRATQVKEKFGTLRFYITGNEEMYKHVSEAESKSSTICEYCGDSARPCIKSGWLATACEKCRIENNMDIYDDDEHD